MKTLKQHIQEGILNTDLTGTTDKAGKMQKLTDAKYLQKFAEYLLGWDKEWEIDPKRSDLGSDSGKCIIIHWNDKIDIVMDFLYKNCSEFLYYMEDPKTHQRYHEINSTIGTYEYDAKEWEDFFDFKTKFRKRITSNKNKLKKSSTYDRPMYMRTIDKYTKLLELLK